MTIHAENESGLSLPFDWEALAGEVIEACLDAEKCPYEAEVDLLLTTLDEIHAINKEHREIDRPTDVLSFPLVDYERPGDFSAAEENEMAYFNPESGELMLGDIIICVPKVFEQAESYGHSPRREFAFLIAHSMFHLMGYDHMDPEKAKVMEDKQEAVLKELQIERE